MLTRPRSAAAAIALAAALSAGAVASSAHPPARSGAGAHASSATCHLSNHDQRGGLGPTYVTSLKVSGTSCSEGVRVVKAYYRCRVHNGGTKGTCHSSVLGFHCSEHRSGISIQFDGQVSCSSGHRHVYHTYVQDT